jgi:hypothetical protein
MREKYSSVADKLMFPDLILPSFSVPDPDLLFRDTDPDSDPDPYIIKQNIKKNLDFYSFFTSA